MNNLFLLLKISIFSLLLYLVLEGNGDEQKYLSSIGVSGKVLYLLEVITFFILFVLGMNILITFLSSVYRRRKRLPRGVNDNVLAGLANIYLLLMTGAILAAMLSLAGVDFKNLFTGLSIVAAAIAIITKEYIANIISGIAISFSNDFTIGDYIKIGENKGKVTDISISKVEMLTDDDDVIFIPNNMFFIYEVVNHSKRGKRTVNIEFEVNLEKLDTVEGLESELIDSLKIYYDYIQENSYRLKIMDIKKDSLSFKFQYILKRIDREMEREIRRKTIRSVVNNIKQEENNTSGSDS